MKKVTETPHNITPLLVGAGLLVLGVVSYLYFLNLSVVHVVMRKEATLEQNQLRAEIAMLETSYIEAQHAIAARIATLDGYNTDTEKVFVNRGETSLVLNNN
jgi:hypothetical protein